MSLRLSVAHDYKIDLVDEIFVINPNGYIGSSTKREIEYAKNPGKWVMYLLATWIIYYQWFAVNGSSAIPTNYVAFILN